MDLLALAPDATRMQGLARRADLLAAGATHRQLAAALAAGRLVEVAPSVLSREALPARRRFLVEPTGPDPAYLAAVRAALLSAGPRAAARGRTAAVLLGADLLDEPDDVELVVPHGRRLTQRAGVDVRQARSFPACIGVVRGDELPFRVTSPVETVAALAREHRHLDAVAVLDALLRTEMLTPHELASAVQDGALSDRAGRRAALRADARSGLLLESVARVRLLEARLGGFVTQHPLVDLRRGVLLRVDVAWLRERLVLEVDGARWHTEPRRDRLRDNALAALGWRVVRCGWHDVLSGDVLLDVAAALEVRTAA